MTRATRADLEALYRERFGRFLAVATAHLGDVEAARDVVQDAFALALRNVAAYSGTGSVEAWVWRIVVNRALDQRRSRERASLDGLWPDVSEPATPDAEADRLVRVQLAALPERQRLAVFLRYYADLDYASIAQALGISRGTVAAALNHARRALRIQLTEGVHD